MIKLLIDEMFLEFFVIFVDVSEVLEVFVKFVQCEIEIWQVCQSLIIEYMIGGVMVIGYQFFFGEVWEDEQESVREDVKCVLIGIGRFFFWNIMYEYVFGKENIFIFWRFVQGFLFEVVEFFFGKKKIEDEIEE